MKRLLLLLPLLLSTPVNAQVDPAVHGMCIKATDYAGCVQTQSASREVNMKGYSKQPQKVAKTWEEEYLSDPRWAKYYADNPEAAAYSKAQWERAEEIKARDVIDNIEDCAMVSRTWNDLENRCERQEETGAKIEANIQAYNENAQRDGCPPGKRIYQKTALFGLIKGAKLCLTDYEAEQLQQARINQIQNSLSNMETQRKLDQIERNTSMTSMPQISIPQIINCTSNTFGNYMSTTCY